MGVRSENVTSPLGVVGFGVFLVVGVEGDFLVLLGDFVVVEGDFILDFVAMVGVFRGDFLALLLDFVEAIFVDDEEEGVGFLAGVSIFFFLGVPSTSGAM